MPSGPLFGTLPRVPSTVTRRATAYALTARR
jgi:hypothetical protein